MGNENFLGKRGVQSISLSIQENGPYYIGVTYTLQADIQDDGTLDDTTFTVIFDDESSFDLTQDSPGIFTGDITFSEAGEKLVDSVSGSDSDDVTPLTDPFSVTVTDLSESTVTITPAVIKAGEEITITLDVIDADENPVEDTNVLNSIDVDFGASPNAGPTKTVVTSSVQFKVTFNTADTYTATFTYGTPAITITSKVFEVVHGDFSVGDSTFSIVKGKAIIGEDIHVRVTTAKDEYGNDFTDEIPAIDFTINSINKPSVTYDTENEYFVVPTTGVTAGENVQLLAGGEHIGDVSLYQAVTATGSNIPYAPVDEATELFTVTPSSGYDFRISIDDGTPVAVTPSSGKITYTFTDAHVSLDAKEIALEYSIALENDFRLVEGTSSITITRIYGAATKLVVSDSTNVDGTGPYTATVNSQITFDIQVEDSVGPIPHEGSITPDFDDAVTPTEGGDDLTFTFTHQVSTEAGTTYTHTFNYPSVAPLTIVISTVAGAPNKVEVDSGATSYESLQEISITVLLTDEFDNELESTGSDYAVKVIRDGTPEDPASLDVVAVNPVTKEVTFTLTIENPGTGLSIQVTHTGSSKIGTLSGVTITKTLTTVTFSPATLNFVAGQPEVTVSVKAENDHGSVFELDDSDVTFSGSNDLSFTFVEFDGEVAIFEVQSEVASLSTTVTAEVEIGASTKSDSIDITVTQGDPELIFAKVSGEGDVVGNKLTIGNGATIEVSFGLKNQYNFNLPLSDGQTVEIDGIETAFIVEEEGLEMDGTYHFTLTAVGEVGSGAYDVLFKQDGTLLYDFGITIELVAGLATRIVDASVTPAVLTVSEEESGVVTVTFGDAINDDVPLTDIDRVTITTDLGYETDLEDGKLIITFWTKVAGSYSMQISISSDSEVLNLNILPDEYDPTSTEVTTYLATLGEESFVALSYFDQYGNSIEPPADDELNVYVVAVGEDDQEIEESRVDAEADSVSSGKRLYKFTIDSVENAAFYGLVVEYDSVKLHELILTVADTPGSIPQTIEGNVVIDDEKNIGGPVNIKGSLTFTPSSNTVIESSDLFEDDFSLFNVDADGSLVLDGEFEITLSQGQFNQLKSTMRAPQSFSLATGDNINIEDSFTLSVATLECDGAEAELDDSDPTNIIVTLTYQEVEGCAAPQPEDDGGDEDGDEDDDDGGLEGGAIAGIAIAAVLGALVIGVIVFLVVKRKCGGKSSSAPTRSYEAETRKQRDDETEEDSEEDTEEDSEEEDSDEEDSEEEDSEEEDSEEDSEEEDSEEGSEEDSEEGSDESSEEGSDESSEEGSDESSEEGSDEGSDESSEEGSDEGSDESSEEGSDESSSDEESS